MVGFCRVNGYSMGVVANDNNFMAGVLNASASQKLRKHVDLCNTFNLPLVFLVDQPGIAVGLTSEKEGNIVLFLFYFFLY